MASPCRPADAGPASCRWRIALWGLAVLAWWTYPLVRPRGVYAGCYRVIDVQAGLVLTLAWLARVGVAATPAPRRRAVAARVVTALGALLVTAAGCDVLATAWSVRCGHIWYHGFSFPRRVNTDDPELVWKHRPGLSWYGRKTPDCRPNRFRTDEQGFRNPPGIRRADIVFLGDSVTEAGEVGEGETFVRKAAAAAGLSAANLGVFGYGPQQELVVLERYGLAYRPRLVVWQVTEWNDPMDAERYARRATPEARARPAWQAVYEQHSPLAWLVARLFPPCPRERIELVQTDGRTVRWALRPYIDSARQWPAGLAATERSIAAAHALCRARGIAFAVLFVPDAPRVLGRYVRPRTAEQRARHASRSLDRPGGMARVLAESCRRRECPFLDLTEPLRQRAAADNRDVYVRNDTHLGVAGHDVAARAIVDWLVSTTSLVRGVPTGGSRR